jgi:hypothetical protein
MNRCHNLKCPKSQFMTKNFVLMNYSLTFKRYRKAKTINNVFNETVRFKNVSNYLNTNIYSYLGTSGGKSSNQY